MGEVFAGRYELVDLIGEGGMGSVWRVWDAREERLVAAKVLRQSDAVSLLRFVREQAVRVRHPHVLTPLGWAGEDDRVLFTMPIVDGGSVATLVGDHGPLPPLLVAEVLRQLLSALESVHGAGIVHRDIKPANILLAATGAGRPHALLNDFGIAVDDAAPRFTRGGGVTGTPGYISPELEEGAEPTPAADLYAAGQVGRAMLHGMRPSEPAARQQPAGTPDALWQAVTALSDPDPGARPASARAAGALLEGASLAWTAEAMAGVEVLRQVPEAGPGRPQLVAEGVDDLPTRANLAHPDTLAPSHSPTPVPRPATADPVQARPRLPGRRVPILFALVLALGVGGVVLWSVTRAGGDGGPSAPSPTPSVSSTPTVTSSSSPSPTPTPAPTPTRGSVEVGTVVVSVGQACGFSDVGLRESTVDGDPVVCQRRPGGDYAWDPPPGG